MGSPRVGSNPTGVELRQAQIVCLAWCGCLLCAGGVPQTRAIVMCLLFDVLLVASAQHPAHQKGGQGMRVQTAQVLQYNKNNK